MRRGEMVGDAHDGRNLTVEELAELMVGRRVLLRVEKGEADARRCHCFRSAA